MVRCTMRRFGVALQPRPVYREEKQALRGFRATTLQGKGALVLYRGPFFMSG